MTNNTTSIFNTTVGDTAAGDNTEAYLEIFNWLLFAWTLAVFLYGVTSWCIIKKFRHFRNYVLISAIFVNVLRFILTVLSYIIRPETVKSPIIRLLSVTVFLYCILAYNYWLLVLCYVFYVDFVKVFNVDIRRRYLKSSLFAWGAPLISGLIYFMAFLFHYVTNSRTKITQRNFTVAMLMLLIPVAINFVIYLLVTCSLFRGNDSVPSTSANKWRRFYISSLIFVLSDASIVFSGVLQVIQIPFLWGIFGDLGEYINIIALNVYLPMVKSNRELWREFVNKRLKQKSQVI